jgi:hypothetical protein
MTTPITTIRNLGAAMQSAFAAAGVPDAETLRDLGPDAAYGRLLDRGSRPHFIAYLAVAMGLQGRHWNDARGDEKSALRRRFDALKTGARPEGIGRNVDGPSTDRQYTDGPNAKGRTHLDAALAEIGVIERSGQPTNSRPEKK